MIGVGQRALPLGLETIEANTCSHDDAFMALAHFLCCDKRLHNR